MANQYHFITRWRVKGTAEEVFGILSQPLDYPRWWPSVYLTIRELASGDLDGRGRRISLLTKGWLPFQLHWEASTVDSQRPHRIVIRANGDFEGRGIWSIVEDDDFVDITFDWKLAAEKPLLRWLTLLLRPAFEANHRWAMEQGLKSLELELARCRAATAEEMNAIPSPDGPKELWSKAIATGTVLAAGLVAGLLATHETASQRAN